MLCEGEDRRKAKVGVRVILLSFILLGFVFSNFEDVAGIFR